LGIVNLTTTELLDPDDIMPMFARQEEEYTMSERRKETRRRLTTFTKVYDLHPRILLGYLGD